MVSINIEKRQRDNKSSSLVTVDKRMVLSDTKRISSGECHEIWGGFTIGPEVYRSRKSRFQEPIVAHSHTTPMLGKLLIVNSKNPG